ncbi:hypothetical protein AGMMS49546_15350 [Spirochaetia bacterium]|nr:hypothetical protein AGMMS49546_15350 [Spirochaetia bacterium]
MALVSAVVALLFTLLAFRALFPGLPLLAEKGPETPAKTFKEIFRQRKLTARETEVALLMLEGLSNEAIAEKIFRVKATVEYHVTNIYQKFGVNDRVEFLAMFVRK